MSTSDLVFSIAFVVVVPGITFMLGFALGVFRSAQIIANHRNKKG